MSRWAFALLIVCAVTVRAEAATKVLYSFKGGSDGAAPTGRVLLIGNDLYGTTSEGGGTGCERSAGCGTVFKLASDGTETVLHVFQSGADGAKPTAGLIADGQGNLYGTTAEGGGGFCHKHLKGCGTLFKVTPDGTTTILHAFAGRVGGETPIGTLTVDEDGNFYGATVQGGFHANKGFGTIYKLAPDGTFTVLVKIPRPSYFPTGGVLRDAQGNLYGVTQQGGDNGAGVLYELAPDGTLTYLHSFDFSEGAYPTGELIANAGGNFYGTTPGSVYKLAPDDTFTTLYTFTGGRDGGGPMAGLIMDAAGNIYGTASQGGRNCGCGTVFELAPNGTETTLNMFKKAKGSTPMASLIMDQNGNLYGTASKGGANGFGSVFRTGN